MGKCELVRNTLIRNAILTPILQSNSNANIFTGGISKEGASSDSYGPAAKNGLRKMAGVAGFEPTMAIPKTAALPLGYTPKIYVQTRLYLKKSSIVHHLSNNISPIKTKPKLSVYKTQIHPLFLRS